MSDKLHNELYTQHVENKKIVDFPMDVTQSKVLIKRQGIIKFNWRETFHGEEKVTFKEQSVSLGNMAG